MDIVALGHALVDIIAFVEASFVSSLGIEAGTVTHLSSEKLEPILQGLPSHSVTAGGGAANTARAASLLGLPSTLVGSVGRDRRGDDYAAELKAAGLGLALGRGDKPTGVFCALREPSGRRTILVAQGSAPDIADAVPDYPQVPGSVLYMDGFLAANQAFFESQALAARSAGMLVAMDLGNTALVRAGRDRLLDSIPRLCDFVFANEDEFAVLAGGTIAQGLERLGAGECRIVVKLAERGSLCARRGRIWESPVRAQRPFDETGAGDAFAAGFLAAIARGLPPERCLRLGNRIAEEALAVPGLRLEARRVSRAQESV